MRKRVAWCVVDKRGGVLVETAATREVRAWGKFFLSDEGKGLHLLSVIFGWGTKPMDAAREAGYTVRKFRIEEVR